MFGEVEAVSIFLLGFCLCEVMGILCVHTSLLFRVCLMNFLFVFLFLCSVDLGFECPRISWGCFLLC